MDTDKQLAPLCIPFVYCFGLQNLRQDIFCRAIKSKQFAGKYGLVHDTDVERITWSNIWKIKNPRVGSIRLKVLYKDVFSNERPTRLGISNSNKCIVCVAK